MIFSIKKTLLFLVLSFSILFNFLSLAEEEITPFQKFIQSERFVKSRESIVEISGVKYRKIEVDGKNYYFSFKERGSDLPDYYCNRLDGTNSEKLIEGSLKIKRRKVVYFSLLSDACTIEPNGQKKQIIKVSPEIGIYLFNGPNDIIKNKKIGIGWPGNLNFYGEF